MCLCAFWVCGVHWFLGVVLVVFSGFVNDFQWIFRLLCTLQSSYPWGVNLPERKGAAEVVSLKRGIGLSVLYGCVEMVLYYHTID